MQRVLFIGDIFGAPGRKCIDFFLSKLKEHLKLDFVIANGENASGGLGLSKEEAIEMFALGIDVITTGNHVWKFKSLVPLFKEKPYLLRPANYPDSAPGQGWVIMRTKTGTEIAIVNLEGRIFMNPLRCPFAILEELLAGPLKKVKIICVDIHAEATSEKYALAWHFDGKVSAIIGTHTHVQTADERVLKNGTAYITDVGMTGPQESVIGFESKLAIKRFIDQRPVYCNVAKNALSLMGVVIDINEQDGRAKNIERIQMYIN